MEPASQCRIVARDSFSSPDIPTPSTEDVENQRLRDSGLQRSKEQYDQLEKQLRVAARPPCLPFPSGGSVPVERPTPPQLARLEMSTHRERQWQRIYVSR